MIEIFAAKDERDEAAFLAEKIKGRVPLKDIAILSRTNAQLWTIKTELEASQIPVQLVSRDTFWQRPEIKNVIAILHLLDNPHDDFSMGRILHLASTGIPSTEILKIKHYALEKDLSLSEAVKELKGAAIPEVSSASPARRIFDDHITNCKYMKWLQKQDLTSKVDSILSLRERIQDFEQKSLDGNISLHAFLESMSLQSAIDIWDEEKEAVNLMTAHCAKGLEWPTVFIVGCEEKLFPLPCKSDQELEEERRLFYVSVTRAKDELICSWVKERHQWGKQIKHELSRFLEEIKDETQK